MWIDALPSVRYFNIYGSTEVMGISLFHEISGISEEETIPTGKPIKNNKVILDLLKRNESLTDFLLKNHPYVCPVWFQNQIKSRKINKDNFDEYWNKYGILSKRINNARYLLVLNEEIFDKLVEDRFSIVNTVRKAAQNNDVVITLSLAFARGDTTMMELDTMASDLMDLAQSRGGDQIAD